MKKTGYHLVIPAGLLSLTKQPDKNWIKEPVIISEPQN